MAMIEAKDRASGKHVVRIVGKDEANVLSEQGWTCSTTILQEDYVENTTEVHEDKENGYAKTRQTISRPTVVRRNLFIMRKDGHQALLDSQAKVLELTSRVWELEQNDTRLRNELAKADEQIKKHEANLESNKSYYEQLRKDLDARRDAQRKMEVDFGKIRQAIGELRMKEILGQ